MPVDDVWFSLRYDVSSVWAEYEKITRESVKIDSESE